MDEARFTDITKHGAELSEDLLLQLLEAPYETQVTQPERNDYHLRDTSRSTQWMSDASSIKESMKRRETERQCIDTALNFSHTLYWRQALREMKDVLEAEGVSEQTLRGIERHEPRVSGAGRAD